MEPRRREILDPAIAHDRTDRYVRAGKDWHFRTRENILVGPFATSFDAHLGASLLCARLGQMDQSTGTAYVIRSFILNIRDTDQCADGLRQGNVTPISAFNRIVDIEPLPAR